MSIWREHGSGHVLAVSNPWVFGGLIVGIVVIVIALLAIKATEGDSVSPPASGPQKIGVGARTR